MREHRSRALAKAVTWQAVGLLAMLVIAFCYTGQGMAAVGLSLTTTLSSFVCYLLHERIWSRIPWGLEP